MKAVKRFAELPTTLQTSIYQAFKTKHEEGAAVGTEANIMEQARKLAAEGGYLWTPGRKWAQHLKAEVLNIAKRPYG